MSPKIIQAHRWVMCMDNVFGKRAALINLLVIIFHVTVLLFMRRPL